MQPLPPPFERAYLWERSYPCFKRLAGVPSAPPRVGNMSSPPRNSFRRRSIDGPPSFHRRSLILFTRGGTSRAIPPSVTAPSCKPSSRHAILAGAPPVPLLVQTNDEVGPRDCHGV